jgi:hypothetical protein
MKTIYNAAMAVLCFVLVVVIDALLDVNSYPQG